MAGRLRGQHRSGLLVGRQEGLEPQLGDRHVDRRAEMGQRRQSARPRRNLSTMNDLIDRYVSVWNEPDPENRRAKVREVFAEDAVHILQPPEESREQAEALAMNASFESRGHAELEARARTAYEQFIAGGEYSFRSQGNAARLRDVITFNWEMVTIASDEVVGVGREFVVLAEDGRIRLDYQFIES
jgi:hypothetical protein